MCVGKRIVGIGQLLAENPTFSVAFWTLARFTFWPRYSHLWAAVNLLWLYMPLICLLKLMVTFVWSESLCRFEWTSYHHPLTNLCHFRDDYSCLNSFVCLYHLQVALEKFLSQSFHIFEFDEGNMSCRHAISPPCQHAIKPRCYHVVFYIVSQYRGPLFGNCCCELWSECKSYWQCKMVHV